MKKSIYRKSLAIAMTAFVALASFGQISCFAALPSTGLIGHWNFNEGSGTTITDTTGNGWNGTASAPVWGAGKEGTAVTFDGTSTKVEFASNPASVANATGITVSAWVNTSDLTRYNTIFSIRANANVSYILRIDIGGKLFLKARSSTNSTGAGISGGGTLSANTWYHVVGVVDYTNSTLSIYVNGVNTGLGATGAGVGGTHYSDKGTSVIGVHPTAMPASDFFKGKMDDFYVYSKALTSTEVSDLFNYCTDMSPVNLALGKNAVASTWGDGGAQTDKASLAVDGDMLTRWRSMSGVDNEWIYVDLGKKYSINHLKLKWTSEYGKQYKIQVSEDTGNRNTFNWKDVYTETSGDGGLDDIYFNVSEARYIKMLGVERSGGTGVGYALNEFEVYETTLRPNLVVKNSGVANSWLYGQSAYQAGLATDGDMNTVAVTDRQDVDWIYVSLGATFNINRVKLMWGDTYGSDYKIQAFTDASGWVDVYTKTGGVGGIDDITFAPVDAKLVRMQGIKRASLGTVLGYSLYEFEVYPTRSASLRTSNSKFYKDSVAGSNEITNVVEGTVLARIDVFNDSSTQKTRAVALALYKGTSLEQLVTDFASIDSFGVNTITLSGINLSIEDGYALSDYSVKLFVWNDFGNMVPINVVKKLGQ